MGAFVLGVVSSLAASLIAVLAGWLFSRRVKRWPVTLLSRLTGIGIVRTYAQQKLANLDLAPDLAAARWVKVLAGRGNELTRDSFQQVWEQADSRLESVEILLPDPNTGPDGWLADREAEDARRDLGYRRGLLAEQVRANIEYLAEIARRRHNVELRLHDVPIVGRVILTDKVAYLTPYSAAHHGRNSPCLVFRNPSPLYDFALRLFATAWSRARPGVSQTSAESP